MSSLDHRYVSGVFSVDGASPDRGCCGPSVYCVCSAGGSGCYPPRGCRSSSDHNRTDVRIPRLYPRVVCAAWSHRAHSNSNRPRLNRRIHSRRHKFSRRIRRPDHLLPEIKSRTSLRNFHHWAGRLYTRWHSRCGLLIAATTWHPEHKINRWKSTAARLKNYKVENRKMKRQLVIASGG